VRHLLAADRVRFGRRKDLWLLALLVPLILAVIFLSEFRGLTSPPQDDFFIDPPDPVLQAQMHDQVMADFRLRVAQDLPAFAFPASLVKVAGNVVPLILMALYLATALIAGEFEWGTVRTLHLTTSRGRTLAVRLAVILGIMGAIAAAALLFAAVIPFFLSFEGKPLQGFAQPVPDLLPDIGTRLLVVVPFISIPAFMAVLGRSTAVAFILTLLFVVADLGITGLPAWQDSPVPWLRVVTVSGSMTRLLGGEDATLAAIAPAFVSVVALACWAIIPAVAAIGLFRRLDLNE
jgi:hypothetical protein